MGNLYFHTLSEPDDFSCFLFAVVFWWAFGAFIAWDRVGTGSGQEVIEKERWDRIGNVCLPFAWWSCLSGKPMSETDTFSLLLVACLLRHGPSYKVAVTRIVMNTF